MADHQSSNNQPPKNHSLKISDVSYADAVAELEGIVGELDRGVVDVDALSDKFQRAIDIVEELDGRIAKTRAKVDQLAPRLDKLSQPEN